MPGAVYPEDLKEVTVEHISALINQGYQFDSWDGDPRVDKGEEVPLEEHVDRGWYLRPQTVDSRGELYDPSWGGKCIFLTNKGCSMAFKERPRECRTLTPSPDFKCKGDETTNKQGSAIAWIPYHSIIEGVFQVFRK